MCLEEETVQIQPTIPVACLLASLPARLGTAVWVLGLCDFRQALNLSEPQFPLLGVLR